MQDLLSELSEDRIEQLFNLVAPIAITGGVDLRFLPKAKEAWKKLRVSFPSQVADVVQFKKMYDDNFTSIYITTRRLYEESFRIIVANNAKNLVDGVDYWGARGFKNGDKFVIVGDACGDYPWYETAELLKKDISNI